MIILSSLLFVFGSAMIGQEWLSDINKAQILSVEQNKNIVLVFQGSDWCAPCMKLEKKIWNSDAFKDYSKEHFILLKADFPKRKKNRLDKEQQEQNNKLAERYNKNGYFPLVLVLNSEGSVLGSTGYNKMKPQEYIDLLASY